MTKKCPYGNHYHHTRRSARLCHHRVAHDIGPLMLDMLNLGLELAVRSEKSKAQNQALRAAKNRRERERKRREEIMTEKKMYKLQMTGLEHGELTTLVIFGASDAEVFRFLKDLEELVLEIGMGVEP